MTLGRDHIKQVGPLATLNANYIKESLKDVYELPIEGLCKHEFVFDGLKDKSTGVTTMDVAKRLLDKNRHYEICYYKQDKFLQVVDNSAMYLHPYRAYFTYEGGRFDLDSKGLEFNIIDDSEAETGIIENTNSDNKLDKIYTLNGIRVNTMQKGQMYIVNGKKFVY
jgi:hypothetical protein